MGRKTWRETSVNGARIGSRIIHRLRLRTLPVQLQEDTVCCGAVRGTASATTAAPIAAITIHPPRPTSTDSVAFPSRQDRNLLCAVTLCSFSVQGLPTLPRKEQVGSTAQAKDGSRRNTHLDLFRSINQTTLQCCYIRV